MGGIALPLVSSIELQRTGSTITAWANLSGSYVVIGTATIAFTDPVLIGAAVSSQDETIPDLATVYSLAVLHGVPAFLSAAAATGTVAVPFSFQLSASNGTTAYAAIGLPAGLSLAPSTGLISGTPTTVGTYTVSVTASNDVGPSPTQSLSVTILPPAPSVSSAGTASGQVGVAFAYQISGSNTPTTFTASGLPPGLSAAVDGSISGTPTVAGVWTATIGAANAGGAGDAGTLTITIAPAPAATASTSSSSSCGLGNLFGVALLLAASRWRRTRRAGHQEGHA